MISLIRVTATINVVVYLFIKEKTQVRILFDDDVENTYIVGHQVIRDRRKYRVILYMFS